MKGIIIRIVSYILNSVDLWLFVVFALFMSSIFHFSDSFDFTIFYSAAAGCAMCLAGLFLFRAVFGFTKLELFPDQEEEGGDIDVIKD